MQRIGDKFRMLLGGIEPKFKLSSTKVKLRNDRMSYMSSVIHVIAGPILSENDLCFSAQQNSVSTFAKTTSSLAQSTPTRTFLFLLTTLDLATTHALLRGSFFSERGCEEATKAAPAIRHRYKILFLLSLPLSITLRLGRVSLRMKLCPTVPNHGVSQSTENP